MYTRVTKDQFEIRDGAYTHTPTGAEFAPNPNSEGSMLIYTGNIGSKLASGELFRLCRSPRDDESSLGGSQSGSGQDGFGRVISVTLSDGKSIKPQMNASEGHRVVM